MSSKTSISLDQTAVERISHSLSQLLADTYITYLKTQNYHWNVIDSRFISLHEFFEKNYKELAEIVDEIAERIRKLQMRAPGSMREFLALTCLSEGEMDISGNEMIQDLCHDRELLINSIRNKIEEASKENDQGTADMLINQLRMHEKAAWMLRSHLMEQ